MSENRDVQINRYFPGVGVCRSDLAVTCGKTQICALFVCLLFATSFFLEGTVKAEKEEEDYRVLCDE